jgi:hypothetical protein
MGYKGTIRSIQAAQRRYERHAKRKQREFEKQRRQMVASNPRACRNRRDGRVHRLV